MRNATLLRLLVVGSLFAGAAACGDESAGDIGVGGGSAHGPEGSTERAREVAEAWADSKAARIWRERYFPMDDAVQLPEGAFRSEADERAYATQNFEPGGPLPSRSPKEGRSAGATATRSPFPSPPREPPTRSSPRAGTPTPPSS